MAFAVTVGLDIAKNVLQVRGLMPQGKLLSSSVQLMCLIRPAANQPH
jgi:hypothetical protein